MRTGFPAAAVLLAVSSSLAMAQGQAPPSPAPVPAFGAGVEVVAVPVFVTDANGRAVGGLRAEDFEVAEEGKVVPLVGFHEIDASQPDDLPEGRAALVARRQFLILFDLSFSSPGAIIRAREAAITFVKTKLGASDLVAVGTFSINRGLQVVLGFTSDHGQLASAISTLGLLEGVRGGDRLNLVYSTASSDVALSTVSDLEPTDLSKSEARNARLEQELREFVVRAKKGEEAMYRQNVDTLVDAFSQLAAALRAIQGRTQVLYLSGGFNESVLVGAQGADAARNSTAVIEGRLWEVDSSSHFGATEVRQQLDRAMKSLAGSDAVVHSIEVGGIMAGADVQSVETGPSGRSGEESLSQIAHLSGGRFVRDTNDVGRALDEILRASERYYLLAFEARTARKPGSFQRLKVKVKNRGYSVSHRTGYHAPGRDPGNKDKPLWLAEQLSAAEAITKGVAPADTGGLTADLLPVPYRDAAGNVLVAVVVELPASAFRGTTRETMPVEVHGYAFDAQGQVADFATLSATLELAKVRTRLEARGLQAHALFTLPAGKYSLRFLVRDVSTGRKAIRFVDVDVPAFASDRLVLYPALLMDTPAEWVLLAVKSKNTSSAGDNPFRVQEDFFTPRVDARLANGRSEKMLILAYTGKTTYAEGASFQLGASLLDAKGNLVRLGKIQLARQVAETDGYRRFVLNVTPENVPAGEYTLRVKLTDPATGTVHAAERPARFE